MFPVVGLTIDYYLKSLETNKNYYFDFSTNTINKYVDKYPLKVTKCINIFLEHCMYPDSSNADHIISGTKQVVSNLHKIKGNTINQLCDEIKQNIKLKQYGS